MMEGRVIEVDSMFKADPRRFLGLHDEKQSLARAEDHPHSARLI